MNNGGVFILANWGLTHILTNYDPPLLHQIYGDIIHCATIMNIVTLVALNAAPSLWLQENWKLSAVCPKPPLSSTEETSRGYAKGSSLCEVRMMISTSYWAETQQSLHWKDRTFQSVVLLQLLNLQTEQLKKIYGSKCPILSMKWLLCFSSIIPAIIKGLVSKPIEVDKGTLFVAKEWT